MIAALHRVPTAPLLRGVVTLAAAAAGVALGSALAADLPEPAVPAQPRVGVSSGPATLALPAGWTALGRRSSLPGFEEATAARGNYGEVALDLRPPEHASLLPAAVVRDGAAQASVRQIAGRPVWLHELPGRSRGTSIAALSLPTTGGVVTVACAADDAELVVATAECEQAVKSARLDGAAPVDAGPATASAIVLGDLLPALNRGRRADRRSLAAARSPVARSAAALRLAERYAAAAARLRPVAAGAGRQVAATLGRLARDHRALARASRRRDPRATRAAGAAIERGEQRLARGLTALQSRSAG